jgi:bifunctional DNA-binding transcriptional regulator/antitoxin component of YhaV-PrlF toxin-antitoxin module
MRIAIDSVGRLVVPKSLRDELGITGPAELEIEARDGMIELAVADIPARVEDRPDGAVITTAVPMTPLTTDEVRAAIDRIRR